MTSTTKSTLINYLMSTVVIGMILSIPALVFAACYFNNGDLLWWIALPIIFFWVG